MLKNICFILSFLLLSHTSYAVIDKRENHQWQSKKNDILAVGQAVMILSINLMMKKSTCNILNQLKYQRGSR